MDLVDRPGRIERVHVRAVALPVALVAAAIVGKLGCMMGLLRRGTNRLVVAVGMMPRGEVTLIFAALGRVMRVNDLPLLDDRGYAALVAVVIVTTLITPPALTWSLRKGRPL